MEIYSYFPFMASGNLAMPEVLIVGVLAVLINACSLLSGDLKESNELGEWVVAKPQTFMYKSYSLGEAESIPSLTRIVAKKQKYYQECLQGKVRSGYPLSYAHGGEKNFGPIEYTESCSRDYVNMDQYDLSEGHNLTLSEAETKLLMARKLLGINNSTNNVVKGVVWRGIRKEIGKGEEKIKGWEYWCFNPALSEPDKRQWISLLSRAAPRQENGNDPDAKMYQRLHNRICKIAWKN
jgi:hypothetical protein